MKYDGENHMVVGNKDAKPLKCPDCGELATGQFVEKIGWCKSSEVKTYEGICAICSTDINCEDNVPAYECVCGCIFNDEGRKLGTR